MSLLVLLLLPLATLRAETVVAALERGETLPAVEVVNGDTLLLENGTEVCLVGIQAPKLPLGRARFRAWPLADEAKQTLEALAHLMRAAGLWLQGELLAATVSRVYSFRDNRRLISEMLARERRARAVQFGIWELPYYAVRRPKAVVQDIGKLQLVEGRVMHPAIVWRRGYVNFGADWKSEFTISIAPYDRKLLDAEGEDILALKGHIVRVRNWINSFNGAMIGAIHPE